MDLAEFDPSLKTPIAPARPLPSVTRSQDGIPEEPPLFPAGLMANNPIMEDMMKKFQLNNGQDTSAQRQQQMLLQLPQYTEEQKEVIKHMQLIYPCYFDINRSVKEGRRVSKEHAVENPLLKTIYDCCRLLKISCIFEPEKTHPQDFGNPGRVRITLKDEGNAIYDNYQTKRSLLNVIGEYLQKNPTTWAKVKELQGPLDSKYEGKNVPRVKGFRMNEIVPLHSPMIYQNPDTELVYKKEYMEKPKPVVPQVPAAPPKPKNKYMQIRR